MDQMRKGHATLSQLKPHRAAGTFSALSGHPSGLPNNLMTRRSSQQG